LQDVGLCCSDIRLFCIEIGLFCQNVELFCRDLGLFCRDVGLCCRDIRLFCIEIGLFCRNVELFCRDLGLFCRDIGLLPTLLLFVLTSDIVSSLQLLHAAICKKSPISLKNALYFYKRVLSIFAKKPNVYYPLKSGTRRTLLFDIVSIPQLLHAAVCRKSPTSLNYFILET